MESGGPGELSECTCGLSAVSEWSELGECSGLSALGKWSRVSQVSWVSALVG